MNRKICGYYLDDDQEKIVNDDNRFILVVAGAGSGKTFTILGKIDYLLNDKGINKKDILLISFTRASSLSLKEKIKKEFKIDMDVFTFHKLSLNILNDRNLSICDEDTLKNIIYDYIYMDVLNSKQHMKYILSYYNKPYISKNDYIKYIEKNKTDSLELLILSFINMFKCNNYTIDDFIIIKKKLKNNIFGYFKYKKILIIMLNIYIKYQTYLKDNNEIDFNDMIIKATDKLTTKTNYKYIIIDEYQDTSLIRFNLIKKIVDLNKASLMVVGDDFQSIYKFTGCDISIFLNFNKYFKDVHVLKINNTYRNSQELIKVAGDFVMKNKKQIKKDLTSSKHIDKPIIIVKYDKGKDEFTKLLYNLYNDNKRKILIIGRNNNDINMFLDKKQFKYKDNTITCHKYSDFTINYLTVHKSKGLEEDNIIIINLRNHITGFPNQMIDHRIINIISNGKEIYPFSEERRLFYVALTRSKNYVYLFVPNSNPSIFVEELIRDYHHFINEKYN